MCDEHTHQENEAYFKTHASLNRRQFVTGMLGVGLMMYLPVNANAKAVTQSYVTIKTPDGDADA
ncbi:MAG TPA: dienelactone hydrolase family protein, partial [Cellvibrio sp.]|nr:dienelactone hydrolase family protein [Cellvibrio sp.]